MGASLRSPVRVISLDWGTLVLRGAARADGLEEVGGDNKGRAVARILKRVGLGPGYPWCAAWVYDVGEGMLAKAWPLPRTASCDVLLEHARRHGMLTDRPVAGDVFLLMRSENDAIHTGFVTEVFPDGEIFRTIEGNTNDDGSANGYCVLRRKRGGTADKALKRGLSYRFIRWHQPLTS